MGKQKDASRKRKLRGYTQEQNTMPPSRARLGDERIAFY